MTKYKLLIVDDELANLRLLDRLFGRDFECLTASSGAEAIRHLEQHDVAILITDQRMPGMTGIELLTHTARLRPHMVRILLTGYTDVEVLVEAVNSGLVYMYVTKPWNNDALKLNIERACEHYESKKKSSRLAMVNDRLVARLQELKLVVTGSLAEMLRSRDEDAYHHAVRVKNYATTIAMKMDLPESVKEDLAAAAMLHHLSEQDNFNIGTTCTRESPSEQPNLGHAHADCEAELLSAIPELATVSDSVRYHRENFDGTGSPEGRADEQIPLIARILRVADEYDLLLQPKRASISLHHEEAMRFLSQRSGKQFDPQVIGILSQFSNNDLSPAPSTSADQPRLDMSYTAEPKLVDVGA